MKVYIVIEERNMDGFSGHYGETAPDYEKIMGVYSTMEKALAKVDELAAQNAYDVSEFECDECRYWAVPYDVQ